MEERELEPGNLDALRRDIFDAFEAADGYFEWATLRSRLYRTLDREYAMLPGKRYRTAKEGKPILGPNPHPAGIPEKAELEKWKDTLEDPSPKEALQRISNHFRFERTGTRKFKVCEAQQDVIRGILSGSEGNRACALQTVA